MSGRPGMYFSDKVCPICQKPFTPRSGTQKICDGCRPIYKRRHNGKRNDLNEARKEYLADKKKQNEGYFAPGCDGCRYWRPMSGGFNACHYCIDREELRHCKPGKDCTVRIEKKRGEVFRKPLTLN